MSPAPQSRRSVATLVVVSLALFMVVLDNLIVTVALPAIRADLGATLESLEWTINAYTLAFAVVLLPGAALAARFVQGVGGAIVAPLTLTLIAGTFPAEKRGAALGIWSAISGLGVALGPL